MTLPFMSVLRTSRSLPRGVTFTGSTQSNVAHAASLWLEAQGENGDSFDIIEIVSIHRAVIECDKPPAPPREPRKGHHRFKQPKAGVRCDVCNNLEGDHL